MSKLILILISALSIILASCSSTSVAVVDGESISASISNSTLITNEFLFEVAAGNVEGAYTVHKFGANDEVGTTMEPITISGFYRTPTTATSLEILSDDADDTAAGTGARKVFIQGLNGSGDQISETVTLSGTTPVPLQNDYLRVYRFYVVESGTYATQTATSQQGIITIREAGGGQTWSQLNVVKGLGVGQSEIGAYTVPKGYNCWLLRKVMAVDSNKQVNLYFFQRQEINKTSAPYSSMRLVEKHIGLTGVIDLSSRSAITKFPELTDIGFMGEVSQGDAEVSVEFELVCLDNTMFY